MAITNVVLPVLILLGALRVSSLPEESFLPISNPGEEDDMYLYMDQRSETDPKQSETRRRSTLDKNFARFGRSDLRTVLIPSSYDDYIPDEFNDRCSRMIRSGDKNDQFIRFGRGGSSDFVRFGRSDKGQNFIRFGRSETHGRSKRQADYGKRGGTNFLRFGRKNDSFMRFGRDPETTTVTPHSETPKILRNDILIRMLLDLLRKTRAHTESTTA